MAQPNHSMSKMQSDLLDEHLTIMTPISGYKDTRLMPLEEAVRPICDQFPGDSLSANVWVAKEKCAKSRHGLSQDESAAIMLYTCGWIPVMRSLYFVLNRTLRTANRDILKPWFPYLRLLIGALIKLPLYNKTIYRGVKQDMMKDYPVGSKNFWWGFSSCTSDINVLNNETFCGLDGPRTMFKIKSLGGRSINTYAYYFAESEVLLLPGRYLQVRSATRAPDGLCTIELEEIQPPHELLELPDNSPWRRIERGICFLGKCENNNCQASGQEVVIPVGLRTFDVLGETDESTARCPMCEKYVEPAKVTFNECQYRIEGKIRSGRAQPPSTYSTTWANTHGYTLNEPYLPHGNWTKLVVEARLPSNSNKK